MSSLEVSVFLTLGVDLIVVWVFMCIMLSGSMVVP